jgi:hypothetical protein
MEAFEVVAVPVTDRYDPEDDRWQDQLRSFYAELRAEVGTVERRSVPVAGTKGSAETIIVALGSAGTFTAAVEFFRSWLKRDKSRSLEISFTDGDSERKICLRGDALNDSALEVVAKAAVERIGGLAWPTPATEPC